MNSVITAIIFYTAAVAVAEIPVGGYEGSIFGSGGVNGGNVVGNTGSGYISSGVVGSNGVVGVNGNQQYTNTVPQSLVSVAAQQSYGAPSTQYVPTVSPQSQSQSQVLLSQPQTQYGPSLAVTSQQYSPSSSSLQQQYGPVVSQIQTQYQNPSPVSFQNFQSTGANYGAPSAVSFPSVQSTNSNYVVPSSVSYPSVQSTNTNYVVPSSVSYPSIQSTSTSYGTPSAIAYRPLSLSTSLAATSSSKGFLSGTGTGTGSGSLSSSPTGGYQITAVRQSRPIASFVQTSYAPEYTNSYQTGQVSGGYN